MTAITSDEILAKVAYNAYGENRDWKTFSGDPMPRWIDLPAHIKLGWIAAADAVRAELVR